MKTDPVKQICNEKRELRQLCGTLAELHILGAPEDLMAEMGKGFLEKLFYPGIIRSEDAVLLTVMDGTAVSGFAAAALDMKRCLRKIVLARPFLSIWYGCSSILFRPRLWKPLMQVLNMQAPEQARPAAEILMVATDAACRGRGFGRRLLSMLDDNLKQYGIRTCIARVRKKNAHALTMYSSAGYKEIGEVTYKDSEWKWIARELC